MTQEDFKRLRTLIAKLQNRTLSIPAKIEMDRLLKKAEDSGYEQKEIWK